MVGCHHQLNGHEFEQTLGFGDGQGGLACCSPWGHKESGMTEQLNCSFKIYFKFKSDIYHNKNCMEELFSLLYFFFFILFYF